MGISIAEELSNKSTELRVPLDVTWEITKHCNQKCKPCYVVDSARNELSLDDGRKLIDSLARAGTLYLTFTGGEPFLRREELKKWAFAAQEKSMAITIFTNGTLMQEEDISWLKSVMPLSVHITLFSASAGIHDSITLSSGSFDRTLKAIERLCWLGLQVVVKTLLIKDNFSEIGGIIRLAKSLGAQWSFDPVVTPRENGIRDILDLRLSRAQIEGVFEQVADSYAAKFKPCKREEFICSAGSNMAAVSAYGDVYPCLMFPQSAGSVKTELFEDIWKSSGLFEKLRNLSIDDLPECGRCKNIEYCSWCPGFAMLEDTNAFGASSVSCMLAEVTKKTLAVK